ncbi:MAG: hypothetical protein AB7V08_01290 [Elusimicrobiales bacterium]
MEKSDIKPLDDLRNFLEIKLKEESSRQPPPPVPAGPLRERYPRLALALQLTVIAGAAFYLYFSFPELKAAAQPRKQLRLGSYDLNPGAETCIHNLWKLAAGQEQPEKLRCPASNLSYLTKGGSFSCPDPAKHGLSELRFLPRKGVVAKGEK